MVHEREFVFDDYHALLETDLRCTRLVICQGMSGSGKTTAIEYLCRQHRHLRDRSTRLFSLPGPGCQIPPLEKELVVLDDLRFLRQLVPLARLLRTGNTVLVASHLPARCFLPFRLFWQSRVFVMDQERGKIERYLAHKQVAFSPEAVQRYCHFFGANYLDVDFILQHHPGTSFDESLGFFLKFCRLDLTPNPLTREKRNNLSLTSR